MRDTMPGFLCWRIVKTIRRRSGKLIEVGCRQPATKRIVWQHPAFGGRYSVEVCDAHATAEHALAMTDGRDYQIEKINY